MRAIVMRGLVEHRLVLSLAVSAGAGAAGLHTYPFPSENVILALIQLERPAVYAGFSYAYAKLWFTTSFFVSRILLSSCSSPATPSPRRHRTRGSAC